MVGRLVEVGWIRDACGSCRICDSSIKDETRCLTQVFRGRDVPGTLARYTVVPERYVSPLNEHSSELVHDQFLVSYLKLNSSFMHQLMSLTLILLFATPSPTKRLWS